MPWWGDLTAVAGLALGGLVLALVPVPSRFGLRRSCRCS